jgi:phosphatidate cytidylyltransferase
LIVAGGVIAACRRRRGGLDHAWKAYCGWLVMVPLLFAAIFLGREATIVFFTMVALLGFIEFARATALDQDRLMTAAVCLGIVAVGVVALVHDPKLGVPGWYGLFMALPVFVIAALLLIPIVRDRAKGQLPKLALAIVGFLYFGWMFGHLAFLANATHAYSYLLYLLLAVEFNDVAAFTCGKLFGRHPLRSNISPKKTWEGAVGALALSLALPWLLQGTFPHVETHDLIFMGLIVGVGGQLGDLAISVIKRDLGVKDMGSAIPGHGGILDRIDSLIYALHWRSLCHDLTLGSGIFAERLMEQLPYDSFGRFGRRHTAKRRASNGNEVSRNRNRLDNRATPNGFGNDPLPAEKFDQVFPDGITQISARCRWVHSSGIVS